MNPFSITLWHHQEPHPRQAMTKLLNGPLQAMNLQFYQSRRGTPCLLRFQVPSNLTHHQRQPSLRIVPGAVHHTSCPRDISTEILECFTPISPWLCWP